MAFAGIVVVVVAAGASMATDAHAVRGCCSIIHRPCLLLLYEPGWFHSMRAIRHQFNDAISEICTIRKFEHDKIIIICLVRKCMEFAVLLIDKSNSIKIYRNVML